MQSFMIMFPDGRNDTPLDSVRLEITSGLDACTYGNNK